MRYIFHCYFFTPEAQELINSGVDRQINIERDTKLKPIILDVTRLESIQEAQCYPDSVVVTTYTGEEFIFKISITDWLRVFPTPNIKDTTCRINN